MYQEASDILVIPNSAKDDVSKLYSSPMKLFGYMASGVSIIASDLPALREILSESLAYFFEPDNPESLAAVIKKALAERRGSSQKAQRALTLAQDYSWQKRVKKIPPLLETHQKKLKIRT